MKEIIDFKWCEKHLMEKITINVATDRSMSLLDDKGNYLIVYTERNSGEKALSAYNPDSKKVLVFSMQKYNLEHNIKNDFTTDDLKTMCTMVGLEYPF